MAIRCRKAVLIETPTQAPAWGRGINSQRDQLIPTLATGMPLSVSTTVAGALLNTATLVRTQ